MSRSAPERKLQLGIETCEGDVETLQISLKIPHLSYYHLGSCPEDIRESLEPSDLKNSTWLSSAGVKCIQDTLLMRFPLCRHTHVPNSSKVWARVHAKRSICISDGLIQYPVKCMKNDMIPRVVAYCLMRIRYFCLSTYIVARHALRRRAIDKADITPAV